MAAAREGAHALAIMQADEAEAVVLDPECPLGAGRHDAAHGREAGLDEAGRVQRHPVMVAWPTRGSPAILSVLRSPEGRECRKSKS